MNEKQKLLVVDDEPDFADFVKLVAEMNEFDVTVVNDPHSFKKSYESTRPDRIVMDIIMPDIDGIELVEWLISEGNEAPVLIVTGYNPHFAEAAKVFAKVRGRFQVSTLTKPMRIDALAQALTET